MKCLVDSLVYVTTTWFWGDRVAPSFPNWLPEPNFKQVKNFLIKILPLFTFGVRGCSYSEFALLFNFWHSESIPARTFSVPFTLFFKFFSQTLVPLWVQQEVALHTHGQNSDMPVLCSSVHGPNSSAGWHNDLEASEDNSGRAYLLVRHQNKFRRENSWLWGKCSDVKSHQPGMGMERLTA